MDANPPPILRLAPELLIEIISLAVPGIYPDDLDIPIDLENSPFHVVRSTCRTFRRIVDNLPFWKEDSFDISSNESFVPFKSLTELADSEVWPTDMLLEDPYLRERLSQRTGWTIVSPMIFEAISRNVPHFGQSLRYLDLGRDHNDNDWAPTTSRLRDLYTTLSVLKV
jgi:hypothetical protein